MNSIAFTFVAGFYFLIGPVAMILAARWVTVKKDIRFVAISVACVAMISWIVTASLSFCVHRFEHGALPNEVLSVAYRFGWVYLFITALPSVVLYGIVVCAVRSSQWRNILGFTFASVPYVLMLCWWLPRLNLRRKKLIGSLRKFRFVALAVLWVGGVMVSHAASWYEAAGALATDPAAQTNDERDSSQEDGSKMRATVNAIVAEYDKIGAGEIVQQCLDASRIVQIAESKTGWKEIVFLIAALASFTVALFITKVIASMFNVAVTKLLWIPIGLCVAGLVALFITIRRAGKHKMAIAAGAALSALGVISVVDPVRHAFFETIASLLLWFTSLYVPFVLAVIGAAGILILIMLVFHSLCPSVGAFVGKIIKNLVALAVIPIVSGVVFLLIMSIVAPRV